MARYDRYTHYGVASEITIVVRDTGFDLASTDPGTYTANMFAHGRGICLIRGLMTEVSFARGGSEIHVSKQIGRG